MDLEVCSEGAGPPQTGWGLLGRSGALLWPPPSRHPRVTCLSSLWQLWALIWTRGQVPFQVGLSVISNWYYFCQGIEPSPVSGGRVTAPNQFSPEGEAGLLCPPGPEQWDLSAGVPPQALGADTRPRTPGL